MEKPFVGIARGFRQAWAQYESMEEALDKIGPELGVGPKDHPDDPVSSEGQGGGCAQGPDRRAHQRQRRSSDPGGGPEPEIGRGGGTRNSSEGTRNGSRGRMNSGRG